MANDPARVWGVDDDRAVRFVLAEALRDAGHAVQAFESARGALQALDDEAAPDLVFTDVRMPGLDGLAATRLLRRGEGLTKTPSRIPSGHPEGYLEAFATLYADAADLIERKGLPSARLLATAEDGLAGMRFISACVRSNEAGGSWTPA